MSYKQAIALLNTLQSNAATLDAIRASGSLRSSFVIPEMREYLARIGYQSEDLNRLNVVHVTGTKGKGSTCAFLDSIIQQCKPHWKVGLYTSPHLVAVRERIRINGTPISEHDFATFFFDVWDRLERNQLVKDPKTPVKPMYFRFLTLVAFHAFMSLKVDATILEVGVGGTNDCTNVVPNPAVTAVTSIGIDHVGVLGKTIPEIAWQKGGIFKEAVPAFTVDQSKDALDVLRERAKELKASEFTVVPPMPGISDIKLGLAGAHQRQNANLAVHVAHAFLRSHDTNTLPAPFAVGLEKARWPGRCQELVDSSDPLTTWFLDGAHTIESLDCCMDWFVDRLVALPSTSNRTIRVLVFNCTSGRSGAAFLASMLAKSSAQLELHGVGAVGDDARSSLFDHVVFCTNVTYADGNSKADLTALSIAPDELAALKTQQELAGAWSSLVPTFPSSAIHVLPSIQHAVDIVRGLRSNLGNGGGPLVHVLVAGSLHLVGGVIEVAGLSEVAFKFG